MAKPSELDGDRVLGEELGASSDLEAWLRILRADPDRQDGHAALQRIEADLRAGRDYGPLIELLLGRAELELNPLKRASLLAELAELYERQLDDRDRAFTVLLACYDALPRRETLRELERLGRATGRAVELVEHVAAGEAAALGSELLAEVGLDEILRVIDERAARLPEDEEERRALTWWTAELCRQNGRPSEALARLELLRCQTPGDEAILREVTALHDELGHRQEHLQSLTQLTSVVAEGARSALYQEMAEEWEALGAPDKAAECLEWTLVYGGPSELVFAALERLYRLEGRLQAAVDVYGRHAETLPELQRAPLYRAVAELFERELGDPTRALEYHERILAAAPGDELAALAVARLAEAQGAIDRAVEVLQACAALAASQAESAARLRRAGILALEQLDDLVRAEALLSRAVALGGPDPRAAVALARVYRKLGEPRRAIAALAPAVARVTDVERSGLLVEFGLAHEALGEREAAVGAFLAAFAADPACAATAERAGPLLVELGRYAELARLCEGLLAGKLPEAVRARRLLLLGRARAALGERGSAIEVLAEAAALVELPLQGRLLRAELLCAERRFSEARPLLEALLAEPELDPAVRIEVLLALGRAAEDTGELAGARSYLQVVLALQPQHRAALKRLIEITAELGAWQASLQAAETLLGTEEDPGLRARYHHVAGRICAEELGRRDEACAHFVAGLKEDPSSERMAGSLEALLGEAGDWVALKAHFAQAIAALGPPPAGEVSGQHRTLWRGIAAACAALGERDGARAALEVLVQIDPGAAAEARLRLAELCAGADDVDQAIAHHQAILGRDQARLSSYEALSSLYARAGRAERAADCALAAQLCRELELVDGIAGAELAAPPRREELARRPLRREEWELARHPEEDRWLGALFGVVSPLLLALEARPLAAYGLGRRDRVASDDPRPFAEALRRAAQLLDVACPSIYLRYDRRDPVAFINGRDGRRAAPALLVGSSLLGDRRPMSDILFSVGLRAALLKPERILRLAFADPAPIAAVLRAAVELADGPGASRTARALGAHLGPLALDQVATIGRRLRDQGIDPDQAAASWWDASTWSAARAALALTGDLAAAVRLLAADGSVGEGGRQSALQLIWSSVTDELAELRVRVGARRSEVGRRADPTVALSEADLVEVR